MDRAKGATQADSGLAASALMHRIYPATAIVAAGCGWIVTMAASSPVVSAGVLATALALGTWQSRSVSVLATTLVLSLPAAASMLVIHAPHGEQSLGPLLTYDGLILAGQLALRFGALMACFLAAVAALHVTDMAKWLQTSRLGYKTAYVVGTSLQFLAQGRSAVQAVRDANALEGVRLRLSNIVPRFIVPVISRLLTQAAQRGEALAAIGFDRPGPRTLLEPLEDSAAQRRIRLALALLSAVVVIATWI